MPCIDTMFEDVKGSLLTHVFFFQETILNKYSPISLKVGTFKAFFFFGAVLNTVKMGEQLNVHHLEIH